MGNPIGTIKIDPVVNSQDYVLGTDQVTGNTYNYTIQSIADFFTGTINFFIDANDPSKLSYERKYGKGIFSTSVLGYWEFNEKETAIIMKEWDSNAGKELAPVTKQIIELTKDRLILKDEDGTEHFYIPQ